MATNDKPPAAAPPSNTNNKPPAAAATAPPSNTNNKTPAVKAETLQKREYRKRRKERSLNSTPEEQALIKKQDKSRKKKHWQKECKWIHRDKLLMSTAKSDVLVTRRLVTDRSTQQRTARQKSAERARENRDNIVNGEVNNFFLKFLENITTLEKLQKRLPKNLCGILN